MDHFPVVIALPPSLMRHSEMVVILLNKPYEPLVSGLHAFQAVSITFLCTSMLPSLYSATKPACFCANQAYAHRRSLGHRCSCAVLLSATRVMSQTARYAQSPSSITLIECECVEGKLTVSVCVGHLENAYCSAAKVQTLLFRRLARLITCDWNWGFVTACDYEQSAYFLILSF